MRVFISYSHLDREFALRLVECLRAWGHDTWIYEQDMSKIGPWPDEIDKGLEAVDVVVGVLSENSMASGRVKDEWDWALKYDTPLIPVRLRPCKVSHRYVRLNYVDCAKDERAGFDQLRAISKEGIRRLLVNWLVFGLFFGLKYGFARRDPTH
jgi:hypothetical protein